MRRFAWWVWLALATGVAQAQPVTALDATVAELRAQTAAIAELMTGKRLAEPVHLRDLAALLGDLALITETIATLAEQPQVTPAQRDALQARVEKTRLMVEQLNAQIRAFAPP